MELRRSVGEARCGYERKGKQSSGEGVRPHWICCNVKEERLDSKTREKNTMQRNEEAGKERPLLWHFAVRTETDEDRRLEQVRDGKAIDI